MQIALAFKLTVYVESPFVPEFVPSIKDLLQIDNISVLLNTSRAILVWSRKAEMRPLLVETGILMELLQLLMKQGNHLLNATGPMSYAFEQVGTFKTVVVVDVQIHAAESEANPSPGTPLSDEVTGPNVLLHVIGAIGLYLTAILSHPLGNMCINTPAAANIIGSQKGLNSY